MGSTTEHTLHCSLTDTIGATVCREGWYLPLLMKYFCPQESRAVFAERKGYVVTSYDAIEVYSSLSSKLLDKFGRTLRDQSVWLAYGVLRGSTVPKHWKIRPRVILQCVILQRVWYAQVAAHEQDRGKDGDARFTPPNDIGSAHLGETLSAQCSR